MAFKKMKRFVASYRAKQMLRRGGNFAPKRRRLAYGRR
jgi:hypothetical protein